MGSLGKQVVEIKFRIICVRSLNLMHSNVLFSTTIVIKLYNHMVLASSDETDEGEETHSVKKRRRVMKG